VRRHAEDHGIAAGQMRTCCSTTAKSCQEISDFCILATTIPFGVHKTFLQDGLGLPLLSTAGEGGQSRMTRATGGCVVSAWLEARCLSLDCRDQAHVAS